MLPEKIYNMHALTFPVQKENEQLSLSKAIAQRVELVEIENLLVFLEKIEQASFI